MRKPHGPPRVGLLESQGHPRTFQDLQGGNMLTCQIVPDIIRNYPASIWDWGLIHEQERS
ncbi:hypothetical protein DPMN_192694 [Dreissena polymorpha]|uniref:Uncharacterized protein n=1 Tax=Dreissena polymorpha TaxID=45954 RepID=A0A9D4BFC7_DREPO|nr:hypothetical protein DPMN_192694 [Dreissena polymorpha]